MYGTAYQFSKRFFTGWVIVSLLWAIFAFSGVTIYPIIEGRRLLMSWVLALVGRGPTDPHEDELDHHRHGQQYVDPDVFEVRKDGVVDRTEPVQGKL